MVQRAEKDSAVEDRKVQDALKNEARRNAGRFSTEGIQVRGGKIVRLANGSTRTEVGKATG